MGPVMRNGIAVTVAWLLTFVAFSLGGYVLARGGPFLDIGRESAASGRPAAEVARSKVASDPRLADEIWRTLERGQRFNDWFLLPMTAVVLGFFLGFAATSPRGIVVILGVAPFGALVLSSHFWSGLPYCVAAVGVAWGVAVWVQKRAEARRLTSGCS